MSEAIPLDIISPREPAHANVLVAVGRDDVLLVGGQEEGRQERCMPEDQRAIRGVLVCGEGAAF